MFEINSIPVSRGNQNLVRETWNAACLTEPIFRSFLLSSPGFPVRNQKIFLIRTVIGKGVEIINLWILIGIYMPMGSTPFRAPVSAAWRVGLTIECARFAPRWPNLLVCTATPLVYYLKPQTPALDFHVFLQIHWFLNCD